MADLQSQLRVDATSLAELVEQVNAILGRLQQGGLVLDGIKLSPRRTTAPTDAPGPGQPNLVVVDVSGTQKLYVYDLATGWVVVGTQS